MTWLGVCAHHFFPLHRIGGGWDTLKNYLVGTLQYPVDVAAEMIEMVRYDSVMKSLSDEPGKAGAPSSSSGAEGGIKRTGSKTPRKSKKMGEPKKLSGVGGSGTGVAGSGVTRHEDDRTAQVDSYRLEVGNDVDCLATSPIRERMPCTGREGWWNVVMPQQISG